MSIEGPSLLSILAEVPDPRGRRGKPSGGAVDAAGAEPTGARAGTVVSGLSSGSDSPGLVKWSVGQACS